MYQLTITADSIEALRHDALAFAEDHGVHEVPLSSGHPGDSLATASDEALRQALRQIKGHDARRLYRDVAAATIRGEALKADNELLKRYDKTAGQSFAGMQAGATRIMRRVVGRRIVSFDYARDGYVMSASDARIVQEVLGK